MNKPSLDEQITNVVGGVTYAVKLDETRFEPVMVRQLKLSELGRYAQLVAGNDEAALVAMLTNKSKEWADEIPQSEAMSILELGTRLNSGFLAAFLERQAARKATMPKSAQELMLERLTREMVSGLTKSAPGSASVPGIDSAT